jgi:hypothetical protein
MTAEAKKGPKLGSKLPDDPLFEVSLDPNERPREIIKLPSAFGSGKRSNRPLTDALLKTLDTGGFITIAYTEDSHKRLYGRFKTLESRMKGIVAQYSLDSATAPTKVKWWLERKTVPAPAPVPPPAPPPKEPEVGREVE